MVWVEHMPLRHHPIALLAGFTLLTGCSSAPHGPTGSPPRCPEPPTPAVAEPARLTRDQALRDLRIVERVLTDLHPGLFRYLTADGLAAEMTRARDAVTDGSDAAEMYLLVSHIAAAVRCGHTWTNPLNQAPQIQSTVFGRADKLPVRLRLVADRLLVTRSATPSISAGSEVIEIDGRDPRTIVADLMPYLRADGSNDGKRRAQINEGDGGGAMDRLFPLVHPPANGRTTLRVRDAKGREREVVTPTVTSAARDQVLAASAPADSELAWTFVIAGDTAVLTLPTFAFWDSDFDWRGFLARSFQELETRRVPYLIIDQRRNEGGDGAIVDAVLSYLITSSFQHDPSRAEVAYERAPYALARYLDTWDSRFFDRTGQVTKGPGRNYVDTAASTTGALVLPNRHRFRGKAFVLVGPENSSAGFILAMGIKKTGAATLVGQPTGGSQRGLNGGQLAWVILPESGVAMDVPLVAWMPTREMPDAGIAPDLVVAPRFEDAAAGIDTDLVAARAAIARLRAAAR
jgi:C-terminal processing protease CtpA/Prc